MLDLYFYFSQYLLKIDTKVFEIQATILICNLSTQEAKTECKKFKTILSYTVKTWLKEKKKEAEEQEEE